MFIFSNLAISLDGKIATRKRGLHYLGTAYDRKHMETIRKQADAILMGAETLRSFKKPCRSILKKHQPMNVILSSNLEGISPRWDFFQDPEIKRVLFVSHTADIKKLRRFERTSEILQLKKPTPRASIASQIIHSLHSKGIHNLLIEGGGGVMWHFVQENQISEYHLTLTPHLIGGKASPSLVEGIGLLPEDVINLRLKSSQAVKNEIYLVYERLRSRGL